MIALVARAFAGMLWLSTFMLITLPAAHIPPSLLKQGLRKLRVHAGQQQGATPLPSMAGPPDPEIQRLLQQPDDRIVSVVDEVLSMLETQKLAYRFSIPPKMVGVHPCNRDGYGISATEVHALGSEIVRMGWSWSACSHAVCIEDDKDGSIEGYTMTLLQGSDGLGSVAPGQVKYGSLACGHTNRFLCAVLDQVPSEHANLCIDGRMSMTKVTANDANMKGTCFILYMTQG